MKLRILFLLTDIFVAVFLVGAQSGYRSERQTYQLSDDWSSLNVVFQDNSGKAEVKPATMAVDAQGVGHLVWLYKREVGDPSTWSINYARWEDGIWSSPIDVLVLPGGNVGPPNIVAGLDGFLHIVLTGGKGNKLWYANVPILDTEDVRSWSKPTVIADYALDADLVIDQNGGLHAVFTTGEPYGPVYYTRTQANSSWSKPSLVYKNAPSDITTGEPRLSVDGRGRIHVIWTEHQLPTGWPPLGQWYTQSEDGGITWKQAIQVGGMEQGQGAVLAIGDDEVHLVWRGTSAAGNTYHQWSDDGGRTWRNPVVFDPDGGFSGRQSLAVDSAGNVYLVRSDGGFQVWEKGVWSPVPALFADSGEIGTIAIGLGNQIHWINTTQAGAQPAVVWHRVKISSAAAIPPQELPTRGAQPTESNAEQNTVEADLSTQVSTPIQENLGGNLGLKSAAETSVSWPITVGGISAFALLVLIIAIRFLSISRIGK